MKSMVPLFKMYENLPPPPPPTKRMPKGQIAAVVVIVATITVVGLFYAGVFDSLGNVNAPNSLTPTRNLEGTWKTAVPVKFYIKTDFETFGELQDVGSENRTMTWEITPTSNESTVYIQINFACSNRQLVAGSGYTPDVSPMFVTGTINGDRLTLESDNRIIGEFSFTTDILTGTWHDRWNMVYEQEVYTSTNSLILTRQS